MYEDKTFANLVAEYRARAPAGISTREGDVYYDLTSPCAWEDSELYFNLRYVASAIFLPTAFGEYLDWWGWIAGLPRSPATPSVYEFVFTGTEPPLGARFFLDQQYYVVLEDDEYGLVLESEAVGRDTAKVVPMSNATSMETIQGLESAQFGQLLVPGVDVEVDDVYRERIRQKLAGPAENGNRQHYKTWCESISGVGRAKIIPLFAGENTVMAVLFDPDGKPCKPSVVSAVQEYVDPMTLGKTVEFEGDPAFPVGDGLGNGVANIGAHFAAVAAKTIDITVDATVTLALGYSLEDACKQAAAAVTEYLRSVSLGGLDHGGTVVQVGKIRCAILGCDAVADYDRIWINKAEHNITVGPMSAPVLAEVKLHAIV